MSKNSRIDGYKSGWPKKNNIQSSKITPHLEKWFKLIRICSWNNYITLTSFRGWGDWVFCWSGRLCQRKRSSWQGHPSWTDRRGRTRPRSAPPFGWDVKPRNRVLIISTLPLCTLRTQTCPKGEVFGQNSLSPVSPFSFPHLFFFCK